MRAEQYLEDLFLAAYLHEYYHITVQDFWRMDPPHDLTEVVAFEKDCWAYTCKVILLPLQKEGVAQCPFYDVGVQAVFG